MISTRLQRLLISLTPHSYSRQIIVCFSLSLIFATLYSGLALQQAFSHEYIVQDDARQHVFWMQRFLDPDLFSNDLIANYFQSVAPIGYTTIYKIAAVFGINPLIFNKLLPLILGAIATCYCFGICMQLLPVPIAGFIASLLLNQSLWMKDDLISATPRAFVYPLFLAFLYYLLQRSILLCLVAIALLGLFYPQYVLICVGILILQFFDNGNKPISHSQYRQNYLLFGLGLGMSIVVILFYALTQGEFEPVITATQAKALPEFWAKGRSEFFRNNPLTFFLLGERSGLLNVGFVRPGTLTLGLLLPILSRFPNQFPLVKQISTRIRLLLHLLLVSIGMFLAAHALLFKLHLPSRYTEHSFRILLALSAGIVLTLILDALLKRGSVQPGENVPNNFQFIQVITVVSTVLIAALVILYPCFVEDFPLTKYKIGHYPALYQFFQEQPKDSLIASSAEEANNLPIFAQRSILVGREYAIPYHWGYYRQFRQRAIDLIQAQYSPNLAQLKHFIQRYGIDLWLLENKVLTLKYLTKDEWLKQYQPATEEALTRLRDGRYPALLGVVKDCSVFKTKGFIVLQTSCILEKSEEEIINRK